ncbi:hypothetical protein ACFX2J_016724 [Malus domestica]
MATLVFKWTGWSICSWVQRVDIYHHKRSRSYQPQRSFTFISSFLQGKLPPSS